MFYSQFTCPSCNKHNRVDVSDLNIHELECTNCNKRFGSIARRNSYEYKYSLYNMSLNSVLGLTVRYCNDDTSIANTFTPITSTRYYSTSVADTNSWV